MNRSIRGSVLMLALVAWAACFAVAQQKGGMLNAETLKKVVPATYFFRGQSAPVQVRNSAGFGTADGKLTLAALVDTSGYASDVVEKYQGLLVTEEKLRVEGTDLPAGAYGFGFEKDGKFVVMDVGAHDLLSVAFHTDQDLRRAVPLQIIADPSSGPSSDQGSDRGSYRLYAGKKWVSLKLQ